MDDVGIPQGPALGEQTLTLCVRKKKIPWEVVEDSGGLPIQGNGTQGWLEKKTSEKQKVVCRPRTHQQTFLEGTMVDSTEKGSEVAAVGGTTLEEA